MDYNRNFEGLFLTVNMEQKTWKENFFSKCGYDLQLLVKAFWHTYNRGEKVLLILKKFVTEF